MSESEINETLEAIKKATEKACQSKEAAIKFLTDAGIITPTHPKISLNIPQ